MTPDLINGLFELLGSVFIWMNVRVLRRDKGHAGVYVPATAFFFTWGLWNLFYYPHLGQLWSFCGGVSIVSANGVWVGLLLWYGRKR